jgi:hypothetical protein
MAYRRKSLRRYKIETTTGPLNAASLNIIGPDGAQAYIKENDPYNVAWITLKFATQPDGTDRIQIWLRSQYGTAYDVKLLNYDPSGKTDIVLPCLESICPSDKIEIVYANSAGHSISGMVTTEL